MELLNTNTHLITINGDGSRDGSIRYDIVQDLSNDEKTRAQTNMGLDAKYATKDSVGALNSALYDVNMRFGQLAAQEARDAENITTNTKDIAELKNRETGNGTYIYNSGRGGYNKFDRMNVIDQYDNLGNGKKIDITREADWGSSTVECGYTVSEDGRYNAETAANKVINGLGSYSCSSNYNKLWYMPINNLNTTGFIEGSITFTMNTANSVSFMPIKCNGNFDTDNWNPGQDVISLNTYKTGHPITIPFCWKDKTIYAIGIKGASSSDSVSINSWYVKYHDTTV